MEGNPHKQIVPDVFVAFSVGKDPDRDIYQVWREGKGPDVVFEVSSASTSGEDQDEKKQIDAKVLKVKEYFLFDPRGEYLEPSLQGFVLQRGKYVAIKPVKGRLTSKELGLQLVPQGLRLRLFDPAQDDWLLTPAEKYEQAEEGRQQAEQARKKSEADRQQAEQARCQVERENEILRQELEKLRRKNGKT